MRTLVVGTPDPSDSTVGSHDYYGRHLILQRPIEERETLQVQHVHLK